MLTHGSPSVDPPSGKHSGKHFQVRPLQYRDLEAIERLCAEQGQEHRTCSMVQGEQLALGRWRKIFSWLPQPWRRKLAYFVADFGSQVHGVIRVSPFNRSQTTWRIDQIAVESTVYGEDAGQALATASEIGSELTRYCLENIWQARTWILELDVNDRDALGLYRQNGFQLLAQMMPIRPCYTNSTTWRCHRWCVKSSIAIPRISKPACWNLCLP
jgi:hypothetical protein